MLPRVLPVLLLLSLPAGAVPWRAEYSISVAGLTVGEVVLRFDLDGPGYRAESLSRSRGVAVIVSRGTQGAWTEGSWSGERALPRRYSTEGTWRSGTRRTVLEYAGGTPRIRVLEPAEDTPRTPVPEEATPGTVDTLSALAQMVRTVSRTARCDMAVRTFDGRRLTDFAARTAGQEEGGLRCEIESRQVAGISLNRDPAQAAQPQVIQAWFARPRSDGPAIPLRVELSRSWWGRVEANLLRLEPDTAR